MEPRHFGVQRIPRLGRPGLLLGLSLEIVKMRTGTEMLPDRGEHKSTALPHRIERLESGGQSLKKVKIKRLVGGRCISTVATKSSRVTATSPYRVCIAGLPSGTLLRYRSCMDVIIRRYNT
jgi:hypothetical protein